ncbi:MAG: hypothetical protein ACSLFF_08475 [Solirubrobacterales bacterium]
MALTLALAMFIGLPAGASACSVDDTNYLESFLDTSCVQTLTNTALDAQGGLRLTTNGVASATTWDTDANFDTGVTFLSQPFGPVGLKTLSRTGTGSGATLNLPTSSFALTNESSSVLSPTTSIAGDGDNVDGPSVIKVGSSYVMYYAGSPEDGGPRAIFQATSTNGIAWIRANSGAPVLSPTATSFDEHGVFGPEVTYDAADVTAPYKMWFSGQGETFGAIGYATSTDGISWTKYTGVGVLPVPVLDHGKGGSADSFAAADPSVIKDGTSWKMWYTGDDSSKKRIAYATSADGITWSKGGKVIAPEDPGTSANLAFGAYAPTVWKDGNTYNMLLAGRKIVSGDEYQTKILGTASSDGISWSGPSPAINPSGTNSNFDYSNLDGPDVMKDGSTYKAYYAGNTIDANGNFHTRIGHATSNNGNSFSKVDSGAGVNVDRSVLDVATAAVAFDGRSSSGLSVATPAGAPGATRFVGFYSGQRGSDFTSRIGGATSPDGSVWTKFSDGAQSGGSLLPIGNSPANFDLGGQRDPSVLYDSAAPSPYRLYFTAVNTSGVTTFGTSTTTEDVNKQPVNASWTTPTGLTFVVSGFNSGGVSHPSVIKDGVTYRMYFTGTDSGGAKTIGYSTSADGLAFAAPGTQILTAGAAGTFDADGVKDPTVWQVSSSDYRMIYTGISTVDGKTTERLGYATSANGSTWTKTSPGLLLDAGLAPFSFDELGVGAAGVAVDGGTTHVFFSGRDSSGRTRGGHATSNGTALSPRGAATYQLGDPTTAVRDFRNITRTSTGAVELWISFLQPYSTAGDQSWSGFFPVTAVDNPETLNFLLTVRGLRWQARLSDPTSPPALDAVSVSSAPVSFTTSGSATTNAVAPPPAAGLSGWASAKVNTSLFQPGGAGSGTATANVLDATTSAVLATAPLNTGGDTTIDLSAVSPATHPQLRFSFAMTSADGQATPRVNSLQVAFNTEPAPPPVATLAASAASVVFGQSVTLTGRLTKGASPMAGQTVTVQGQPVGSAAFAAVTSAVTDASGNFTAIVKPDRLTTYKASFAGLAAEPTAAVSVAHLVKLKVKRKGTKGYVKGSVGPAHTGLAVQVQQKKGSRWVTVKKLKTTSKSAFATTVTKLKKTGKYQFRALTPADAQHLAGTSAIAYVDAFKVSLTVKRSGRTLTFTGKVSPAQAGKTVVIKQLKAGKWASIAKVKLSRTSTFTLKKKFAVGTYDLRADKAGTTKLWPGTSPARRVIVP